MLPGKKYTPEEILFILRRRIWVVLVPFAIVSAGMAIVARKLPDRYRSEAAILVVPQQVPEAFVKSAVTTSITERLQSIQQQILSRTRLEQIIEEQNLYADLRRTGIMEDVVEKMRTDIDIAVFKGDAFKVSYMGSNPKTVMHVTEKLAGLFIQESLKDREVLTEGTNQFLEGQLEEARRRLQEQEKKLQDYRMKFSGQLPSQLEANLQALNNTQMQIQNVLQTIDRAATQKLMDDRQLEALQADPSAAVGPVGSADPAGANMQVGTTAQKLAMAKNVLSQQQLNGLKDGHPDVQTTQRLIRDLTKQLETESLERPVSADDTNTGLSAAERQRKARLDGLKLEKDQLDKNITALQAEEKRLRSVAASYQQKIDLVPARESEMVELTRDYGTLQGLYSSLLSKKEESNLATNLERRQIGEQFKLLDPARIPERPTSPNRPMLNLLGMVGGLVIGLAIVAFLEYRDASFKTDDEITRILALPVLAVVPLMESDQERTRGFKRRLFVGVGLGTAVVGCLGILVYTFVR